MKALSRRTFLMSGAALAAAVTARAATPGPNERVRLGLIGCGVRGRAFHAWAAAVCDPDSRRRGEAAKAAGLGSRDAHADFRRLLDDPSIDAVAIATPDHWHAPAALLALEAGKHVYVEKPFAHNFRECQLLREAARRSGLVVQHGTQSRSRPAIREAIDGLRGGVIGDVLIAKAWNVQRRGEIGRKQPSAPPAEIDYDLWVGPAAWAPYQANRLHSDWHWWWNFGTGDLGNDGAHEIDYARWGLGVEGLPTRVTAMGGKYVFDDDQQTPDTATCVFEYAAPEAGRPKQLVFEMRLWSDAYPVNCDSGVEFYGTAGQMTLSKRGKLRIVGPRNEPIDEVKFDREQGFAHLENFFDAVRGTAQAAAPPDEAVRSVAPIHLANALLQCGGGGLRLDPATESIVDHPEAAKLLGRTYREGGHWAVPQST